MMSDLEKKLEPSASEKLAQMEKEKLSRRQALARLGFQAGAAAVAALTADDLFRKVGAEMQKRAGDNKVANQVAKELQGAGVAFASVDAGQRCLAACATKRDQMLTECNVSLSHCIDIGQVVAICYIQLVNCQKYANSNYTACISNC